MGQRGLRPGLRNASWTKARALELNLEATVSELSLQAENFKALQ